MVQPTWKKSLNLKILADSKQPKSFLNSQMQVFKPAFCFPITTQQIYLVQPQVRLQFRLKVLSSLNRCEVIIQTMLSERLIIFSFTQQGVLRC